MKHHKQNVIFTIYIVLSAPQDMVYRMLLQNKIIPNLKE